MIHCPFRDQHPGQPRGPPGCDSEAGNPPPPPQGGTASIFCWDFASRLSTIWSLDAVSYPGACCIAISLQGPAVLWSQNSPPGRGGASSWACLPAGCRQFSHWALLEFMTPFKFPEVVWISQTSRPLCHCLRPSSHDLRRGLFGEILWRGLLGEILCYTSSPALLAQIPSWGHSFFLFQGLLHLLSFQGTDGL